MKILRFLFENFIDDSENFEDLNVPKINCINGYFIDNSICVCNEGFTTSLEIKINEDGSINKCDISIKKNNNENYEKKSNFLSFILKLLPFFLIAIVFIWIFIKIWLKCKKNKKNSNKNSNKNNNNKINKKNNFDEIESTSRNFNNSNLNKKNFNNNNNNKNIQRKNYNNNNKKVLFKTQN